MFEIKKCARCGKVPDGHAWIDDLRYCHGDDVEVTCFMRAQWSPRRFVRLTGGTLDIGGDISPEQAELFREEFEGYLEYIEEGEWNEQ